MHNLDILQMQNYAQALIQWTFEHVLKFCWCQMFCWIGLEFHLSEMKHMFKCFPDSRPDCLPWETLQLKHRRDGVNKSVVQ